MKIVIPGGSGQVGAMLARYFIAAGHEVVILTRSQSAESANNNPCVIAWDGRTRGPWAEELEGADVVINLAGRSVNCRYNSVNRRDIIQSRVDSTHIVGEAIAKANNPPRVWLQSSTATIYCHRYEAPNDEVTGILGGDEPNAPDTWRFSIDVAKAWEAAAEDIATPGTRKVLLRSAMTMSPDAGGVFDVLMGLVNNGLGGTNGDGRQYVSWIHEADFCRAVQWLIDHDLAGPVNLAAPQPLPNAEFMRTLRQAAGVSWGLPATNWMLEIGAIFLQTETELILKSRRVVPKRLVDDGFDFHYANWKSAAEELVSRWRVRATSQSNRAAGA